MRAEDAENTRVRPGTGWKLDSSDSHAKFLGSIDQLQRKLNLAGVARRLADQAESASLDDIVW